MDVWGLTVAAFRRWYVLIPLLLLSITVAFFLGSRAQSDYEVEGAVMMVTPGANPVPWNPYAAESAVQILAVKAMSSSTRTAFLDQGLSNEYEILYDRNTPVMTFTVVGSSSQVAVDTAVQVVDFLETTLSKSQKELGIRPADRVTITIIDAPDVVEPTSGGRLRVTAIVGTLGILASVAIAVLVDGLMVRRQKKAMAASADNSASVPEGLDEDESTPGGEDTGAEPEGSLPSSQLIP